MDAPRGAYVATPDGEGPWPGVVVLHESLGLTGDIRAHTDRLAREGYLAVAPDLFRDGGRWRCLVGTFRSLSRGSGRPFEILDEAQAWLAEHPSCSGRIGVLGFCMGGGFALLAAVRGFDVSAPNYAHQPKDLDTALRGACPVVASYGGKDLSLRGAADRLEGALDRLGVEHDVVEYPEAGHSFMNHHSLGLIGPVVRVTGVRFHGPSADDAWRRILAAFSRHLAADP